MNSSPCISIILSYGHMPYHLATQLLKSKKAVKEKPSTAFHSGKYDENVNISGATLISLPAAGYANDG